MKTVKFHIDEDTYSLLDRVYKSSEYTSKSAMYRDIFMRGLEEFLHSRQIRHEPPKPRKRGRIPAELAYLSERDVVLAVLLRDVAEEDTG